MWAKISRWLLKALVTLLAVAGWSLAVALAVNGTGSRTVLFASALDMFSYMGPLALAWLVISTMGGGGSGYSGSRVNTDGTPMIGDSCIDARGNAYGCSGDDDWPRHD